MKAPTTQVLETKPADKVIYMFYTLGGFMTRLARIWPEMLEQSDDIQNSMKLSSAHAKFV